MTTHRQTLRYTCLTLALGLTAGALAALACGPSAPAGQDGATPTPDPTETATPRHQAELGPLVNAVVVQQATIAALPPDGATGQQARPGPETINVILQVNNAQRADVERFLSNNNVNYSTDAKTFAHVKCPDECGIYDSDVPVSLLQDLSQQPGVKQIYTLEQYYKKLHPNLNLVMARYDAGLITAAEAVAESMLLSWGERILIATDFDTSANAASAIRYLKNNGVYLMTHPAETTVIGGFIPVSLILPLSQQPGVTAVTGIGYGADLTDPDVQESLNRYKPPQPTSAGGPVQGQAIVVPPTPVPIVPAPAAAAHGADDWHGLGINGIGANGERIKIGVIDVGFNGYNRWC